MKRNLTALITGSILMVMITGCASLNSSGLIQESHLPAGLQKGSRLMENYLEVVQTRKRLQNDLLSLTVVTENKTDKDLQCEYRFSWYDETGIEVSTPMSIWKPAHYHAGGRQDLSGIAPSANVTSYRLVLRFRHPSSRF